MYAEKQFLRLRLCRYEEVAAETRMAGLIFPVLVSTKILLLAHGLNLRRLFINKDIDIVGGMSESRSAHIGSL